MKRLLAVFLLCAVCLGLVLTQIRIRTDITDFLPPGTDPASRFLLREVREGEAATLLLAGIDGPSTPALVKISQSMAARLRGHSLFSLVMNSSAGMDQEAEKLFADRYLLSDAVTPEQFTTDALHHHFEALLTGLSGAASPVVARYGFADPTGAFGAIAAQWLEGGFSGPRTVDGVWFAPEQPDQQPRALLLTRLHAGSSIEEQQVALSLLRSSFEEARHAVNPTDPGAFSLHLTGPAIFAEQASSIVKADIHRIAILSGVLILGLLLWRFRSPAVLVAMLIPPMLGIALAAVTIQLWNGSVHGVTLGFGLTMLGVTLDYPVLWIGHRRPGEAVRATQRRIGMTLGLTMIAASLGLIGMVFSSFPALAQLGLFSVMGLLGAGLATFLVLPPVVCSADLAPALLKTPGWNNAAPAWMIRLERLHRFRPLALLVPCLALLYLAITGLPPLERDLAHLSPVPASQMTLDETLRRQIGAPDASVLIVFSGTSQEDVLRHAERLTPFLHQMRQRGLITSSLGPADLLPSEYTQRQHQAALPPAPELHDRVMAAMAGLPFANGAFDPFLKDAQQQRMASPLHALPSPLLRARLAPMLFQRGGSWYGIASLTGLTDADTFKSLLDQSGTGPAQVIDIREATNGLVNRFTGQAFRWLGAGALLALFALAAGLRQPKRLLAVLIPIGAALCVTLALLKLAGVSISLFHVTAIQLMIGISLDYALFLTRRGDNGGPLDLEERVRTLRTLLVCNGMTLLSFGLLATCQTPLLASIGLTVASGTFCALVLAFFMARPQDTGSPAISLPSENG
ncbi:Transporter [Granulibacter bethesdensis]|uniref:Transporter n=1 Tax=Granulibacter bethesdensis TaxID=364410 RepID=A0AAN0VEM5_9PROT|nr:MMPL family transporter [Granulibacter bethesdensis]AHJ61768.1 Transporter [Granulibacter bethesdensis]